MVTSMGFSTLKPWNIGLTLAEQSNSFSIEKVNMSMGAAIFLQTRTFLHCTSFQPEQAFLSKASLLGGQVI
jgi:hypothetical protein